MRTPCGDMPIGSSHDSKPTWHATSFLDLPDAVLVHLWSCCCPQARRTLLITCKQLARVFMPCVALQIPCSDHHSIDTLQLPLSLAALGFKQAIFVSSSEGEGHRVTSIEQFFKQYKSPCKPLHRTWSELKSNLQARLMLTAVACVTLQSWDLLTSGYSTATLLTELFPNLQHLDISTCSVPADLVQYLNAWLMSKPGRTLQVLLPAASCHQISNADASSSKAGGIQLPVAKLQQSVGA